MHDFCALISRGLLWRGEQARLCLGQSQNQTQISASVFFRIEEIDSFLPAAGLAVGAVHEWALACELSSRSRHNWYSPLFVISALLKNALSFYCGQMSGRRTRAVAWIGKHSWLTPHALEQSIGNQWAWYTQSLFVDPPNKTKRLWTALQFIRSAVVPIVVLDGSGFSLTATRQLQLAAKKQNAFVFLVRPSWELEMLSAAQTRWCVSPAASLTTFPRWKLELKRARGTVGAHSWFIEWKNNEQRQENSFSLCLSPDVVNRSDTTAHALGGETTRYRGSLT